MSKTYYDIALNEYRYLNYSIGMGSDGNNPNSAHCQQIAEKLLKHVLSEVEPSAQELRIHNLKKINAALKNNSIDLHCDDLGLAYLTDLYHDAGYPGDDYVDVTDEDLRKCIDIMESIKTKVELYLRDKEDIKLDSADILDKALRSMSGH